MLKFLINIELTGITFIRGYIQFLFEGAVLNTYTLPQIKTENKEFTFIQCGYYDKLCSLIGKHILSVYEGEDRIVIQFENNMKLVVSLNLEDRRCAEAAMLQIERDGKWETW